jgi:hypothetical protein
MLECRRCGNIGAIGIHRPGEQGPHFMALVCSSCDYFIEWLAWPKTEEARKRERKRSRRGLEGLGEQTCWFCGRSIFDLPKGQTIEAAHINERAELIEEGLPPDELENVMPLCTRCHKHQHHMLKWWAGEEAGEPPLTIPDLSMDRDEVEDTVD